MDETNEKRILVDISEHDFNELLKYHQKAIRILLQKKQKYQQKVGKITRIHPETSQKYLLNYTILSK